MLFYVGVIMNCKICFVQKLLCYALILVILSVSALSMAQDIAQIDERDQYIRVLLTRLADRERLDFTLSAPYRLVTEQGEELSFQAGSEISLIVQNDEVYLYYQLMSHKVGKSLQLLRLNTDTDINSGLYVTNFPPLYMGDLQLNAVDGKLRAVLTIHVENYLLGVIPYEMGDSFPLEALKAQAVAARTYALNCQGRYADYDLVDNTNDQAFKGYAAGHPVSEQAVRETRGICGFYQGELAQCFYSASNGGQTELVQNVWSDRKPYPYYSSVEDPYDVANPESTVLTYEIKKQYDGSEEAPLALRELISEHLLHSEPRADGEELSAENIQIDHIRLVSVDQSERKESKLATTLHLEGDIRIEKEISVVDTSPEEVHLFADDTSTKADSTAPVSVKNQLHLVESFAVDVPVFPHAEKTLSLSINSNYENEIWRVVEKADRFVIEVRRYGHGVGMSQRGAQWMASEHQMTYLDILAFYYPGMELVQFPEQKRVNAAVDEYLLSTPGPAPTVTPRPTLMPVSLVAEDGQWYAVVTEIADDSSLNLRSAPGLNSDILMRLYKGQRLLVVERCPEDGWVHVFTDAAEGYVMERYLTMEMN